MDFLDTTFWRPIHTLPGFQSCIEYFISRDGQVLSTKGRKEKILKQTINADGYAIIRLRKRLGERGEIGVVVHKLVAYAFLPPPPVPHGRSKGCCVINHIDHNRSNNCVENLEWNSASENSVNKINFIPPDISAYESLKIARREHMRRKRKDPEFRKAECAAQKERMRKLKEEDPKGWKEFLAKKREYKKRNADKEAEWMKTTLDRIAADPERVSKRKEYKKNYREKIKANPDKLAKQREYQREYMRKKRAAEKKAKIE